MRKHLFKKGQILSRYESIIWLKAMRMHFGQTNCHFLSLTVIIIITQVGKTKTFGKTASSQCWKRPLSLTIFVS